MCGSPMALVWHSLAQTAFDNEEWQLAFGIASDLLRLDFENEAAAQIARVARLELDAARGR